MGGAPCQTLAWLVLGKCNRRGYLKQPKPQADQHGRGDAMCAPSAVNAKPRGRRLISGTGQGNSGEIRAGTSCSRAFRKGWPLAGLPASGRSPARRSGFAEHGGSAKTSRRNRDGSCAAWANATSRSLRSSPVTGSCPLLMIPCLLAGRCLPRHSRWRRQAPLAGRSTPRDHQSAAAARTGWEFRSPGNHQGGGAHLLGFGLLLKSGDDHPLRPLPGSREGATAH